jgi:hypothetical protein
MNSQRANKNATDRHIKRNRGIPVTATDGTPSMDGRKTKGIAASAHQYSLSLGMDDATIIKALEVYSAMTGAKWNRKEHIPLKLLVAALAFRGSKDESIIRRNNAAAALDEQQTKVNEGLYVDKLKEETELVNSLRGARLQLVAFAKKHGPQAKKEMEKIFKEIRRNKP